MPLTPEQDRMLREIHAVLLPQRDERTSSTRTAADADDPIVRFTPREWHGEDLRGKRFSSCPPAFLALMAGVLDKLVAKNERDGRLNYARWDAEAAAAARKWLARISDGALSRSIIPSLTDAEMARASR